MNITLPQALEEFVREQVASGMYDSCSEVHREALRLLMEKRSQGNSLHELRAAIDTGIAQADRGESRSCDTADIIRLAETRRKHG